MKPVYLEFCGINSFSEKAEIDFSKLLSGGVFGIFGDTGSGKSTVLDSIHFALYGEIDRAPKSFNDCINYKSDGAYVVFDFELTTDGERHTYRVRRERKRKSGTTKAFLYEYTQNGGLYALAEGARDVDEKLERIIGLTFEDFKTCIALPQGDFAALVKSTPAERVKLVARLFNLEKYGERLAKAVNEKYYRAEEEVNLVKAKMDENEGGNDERIAQTQSLIAEYKISLDTVSQRLAKAEERYITATALLKEKLAFEKVCAKLESMQKRLAEMEQKRALLERLPKAKAVWEKSLAIAKESQEKLQAERLANAAKDAHEKSLALLEQRKKALQENEYENIILTVSMQLQKITEAEQDVQAEQKAKAELDECIAKYKQLLKNCVEEDFAGKRERLEKELFALGEDATLFEYIKHNFKATFLPEAYGEFRADLRGLKEKYPQTQADIDVLLQKYAAQTAGGNAPDIEAVKLQFKEIERNRKRLQEEIDALEKRKRAYEENESKKQLLKEQGAHLRQRYELAAEKTAAVKALGDKSALLSRLEWAKAALETAKKAVELTQEQVSGYYAEWQKQAGLFALRQENQRKLQAELTTLLKETEFSDVKEAETLVQGLGDEHKAQATCKAFFEEYELARREYERADKQTLESFDASETERTAEEKRMAGQEQRTLLQLLGAEETKLQRLLELKEKYKQLEKQLVEKERYKNLCDELRSLLKGNRFLEFIASEYLQDVCIGASKTLLSLTGGRYFLQYDKEFKVGDNLDGGNLRGVKTLSGGETFLVSLSLALSLSSAICLKSLRPIEFFFLDEGFGTLDEKLVETVMDVLGKLSKTFAVGLISHVEELKHRIDNKILVTGATERHGSKVQVQCF